ncbi:aldehyde dehydrogenase family protein [Pseudomonas vancouverensis]|uniref:Aldehyde dehydrogenase family protein n=1 Tax=Pseudomonas vancouverensis TaxID=95300 RepID=A0A1H2N3X1_PSEVA|nr:aldehyde dehydrogenase family protein [Pseudomonas vancouverensis]KAB0495857.1 aldehyde dehydrogenase family protein [Pseudomonas vancouverensis]TDB65659.1 aldehyde dehydrogenase family protein [Pseudomonas vancouverensis]SDV00263.1 betaine-aldehyde dehydrogenase [Pseudomonas vancouverensis]
MTAAHYINGQWVAGEGADLITVFDPSLGQPFAELKATSAAQVDQAVAAARQALPAWKNVSASQRAAYLRGFAEQIDQRREELITLQMQNNGKPRHEAVVDIDDAVATFNYYAGLAEQLDARQNRDVPLPVAGFTSRTRLEPVGVVGLIVPWNFPLVTSAWKLAPALAAGCTVVLKPSEVTPLIEQTYGQIADAVGLPAGVLNIVGGKAETGAALSNHPGLDKLSFTGSNGVGSQVMRSSATHCRPVTLELGGKSAIVVFDDCDLDQAVEWIVAGICWNAGQMCSATSRLLVQDSIADALSERLKTALETLRVGNPLTGEVDMGPLTSLAQWNKVNEYFAIARAEGLRCASGGDVLRDSGWFVCPTLYTDVPLTSRLWSEEIFGPVLCSHRFSSEEQALTLANDSRFGLVATVISADLQRAERVANALEVGHVWINSIQAVFVETSWGGTKGSGIGRELGPWGLSAYQSVKHVTHCLG